jgi:Dolichyl-phosphate-mannose-protein mannosyltransferase
VQPTPITRALDKSLEQALRLSLAFAAIKLALQFACTLWGQHIGYGYFRDEFYYIACGRHLGWGYVDHGPLVAVQARIGELLFGDSLFAIRLLSAIAGAATIFLTGILAWVMGGRRTAQVLAMIGVLFAPEFIGLDGFLSMNSFEPVFWMTCVLSLLVIQRGYSPARWWTIFGVSAGLGLLNKPSMTFFLIAVGLGLVFTKARRLLFSRWTAIAIALMVLIALPNVLWQVHNHWPTLEFLRDGQLRHKNVLLKPLPFFGAQVLMLNPLSTFLWITGVVSLLRARTVSFARWLGLTYIFFFAIMLALHAKDYYLAPIYPALFSAGALAWESRFLRERPDGTRAFGWPVLALETVLVVTGALLLPLAAPVLAPDTWVRYATNLHLKDGGSKTETAATSELPQFFADRFGWQQLSDQIVATFRTLPASDRAKVCVFTDNYGEAGASDFLGRRIEPSLPPAISGHNSYWLWGPRGCDGQLVIAYVDDTPEKLQQFYEQVTVVGGITDRLAMPFEHKNLYLLRGLKGPSPLAPGPQWLKQKDYI